MISGSDVMEGLTKIPIRSDPSWAAYPILALSYQSLLSLKMQTRNCCFIDKVVTR